MNPHNDRGRSPGPRTSGLVMAAFATIWWLSGATALRPGWRSAAAVFGLVIGLTFVAVGRRYPPPYRAAAGEQVAGARFGLINLVQAVAIVAVVVGSVRAGAPGWIPALIAVIVGAHFLPLATLFGWVGYRWTGVSMIVAGLVGVWLLVAGAGVETVRVAVCLACAVLLWLAVLWPAFGRTTPVGDA